jgi:membrane associated rhomboid family serine protease
VFVPLSDENPLRTIKFQYVTVGLIALNIAIYLYELAIEPGYDAVARFAVVPAEIFASHLFGDIVPAVGGSFAVPEAATLVTYMFLHAGWMHLLGNMLFLWVFGDNVEDALGHVRFLVFYLACGVAAALFHAALVPDRAVPLIGASGAISGVIAAYLILHPRVSVWVLVLKFIPLRISAMFVLGVWIALQILMLAAADEGGETALLAHIGGFLAGAVLILVMRRRPVPAVGG